MHPFVRQVVLQSMHAHSTRLHCLAPVVGRLRNLRYADRAAPADDRSQRACPADSHTAAADGAAGHRVPSPTPEPSPEPAAKYYQAGVKAFGQGRYGDALLNFTQALSLDPKNALLYLNRAQVYLAQQDYDGAISDFTQVIQLDPRNVVAWVSRGPGLCRSAEFRERRPRSRSGHPAQPG